MADDQRQINVDEIAIPFTVGDRQKLAGIASDLARLTEAVNEWRHDVEKRVGVLETDYDERQTIASARAAGSKFWLAFLGVVGPAFGGAITYLAHRWGFF